MRQLGVIFCLFCFAIDAGGQSEHLLVGRFLQDSMNIAALREKHEKYMPTDLDSEITNLERIVAEMCAKGFADEKYCNKIQEYFPKMIDGLNYVAALIDKAEESLAGIEQCMNDTLRNLVLEKRLNTPDAYDLFIRQRIESRKKEYEKQLAKIKQAELYLARRVYRHIKKHAWGEDLLITTMVTHYLKSDYEEKIRNDKEKHDALTARNNYLSEKVGKLGEEIQLREDEIVLERHWFEETKSKLLNDLSELEKEHDRLSEKNASASASLRQLNRDMDWLQDSFLLLKDSLRNSLFDLNSDISSLNKSIEIKNEEITELGRKSGELDKMVAKKEAEISARTAELAAARKENYKNFILVACLLLLVFFLVIYIIFKYRKKRYEHFAKLRLQRVNEELKKVNDEVTEANAQLKVSNDKLVALMRELNHRTKNNLQQINGLLMLHERELEDEGAKNALMDARGRIIALGAIHQQLYRNGSKDLGTVNIAVYVKDLVEHLIEGSSFSREQVEIRFDLQELHLESDEAVDLGLIINELVNNCIKHGFQRNGKPALWIKLKLTDGTLRLEIRDNGPGLPEDFTIGNQTSFGLRMIRKMVEHRDGNIWWENNNGASFIIRMPVHALQSEQSGG